MDSLKFLAATFVIKNNVEVSQIPPFKRRAWGLKYPFHYVPGRKYDPETKARAAREQYLSLMTLIFDDKHEALCYSASEGFVEGFLYFKKGLTKLCDAPHSAVTNISSITA